MTGPSPVRWMAPPDSFVKVNFDARFLLAQKKSWTGVIIRDGLGHIMGAYRKETKRITSAFSVEAQAALHAIQFSLELGFGRVIIEGDSKSVINKLSSLEEISAWIWEARRRAEGFHACSFRFTPRNGNHAAHLLAHDTGSGELDRYWIEEAPQAVELQAAEDRRFLDPP
ncbi:uncharacterized protein LOC120122757 [Hibiscus syriacus]|uniref:uncharacterized protein LOC120122757 n=1 Tax=Hibiscus syriacus TaxID=106335 RepID=UPI001922C33A|nr:uncharacterized protein LOC120122757 [Hibiscus syriacus]